MILRNFLWLLFAVLIAAAVTSPLWGQTQTLCTEDIELFRKTLADQNYVKIAEGLTVGLQSLIEIYSGPEGVGLATITDGTEMCLLQEFSMLSVIDS
jgi:hypothetical protein